jgi:hypothetical protein
MARYARLAAVPAIAFVAGLVLVVIHPGRAGDIVGLALLALGGVGLVSLAFLAVGESEDRDRQRNPHG